MTVRKHPSTKKKKSLNEFLISFMPKVDKLYHLYVGFVLAAFGFVFDMVLIHGLGWYSFHFLTIILPLSFALIKEFHDEYFTEDSRWCWIDILYTMTCSIVMITTTYLT